MYRETTTKNELKELLIYNILKYKNCISELRQGDNPPLYIITNQLTDNTITISVGTGDKIVGDIVKDDRDEIENVLDYFILDRIPYTFYAMVKVTPISENNKNAENNSINVSYQDLKEEYIENQEYALNSTIRLKDKYDIKKFFKLFLFIDECNKLLLTFSVSIPDLENDFCMSVTCDKIYLCNHDAIAMTLLREDTKNVEDDFLHFQRDKIIQFNYGNSNTNAIDEFMKYIDFSIQLCNYVSDERIKINAYTNVKLN